MGRRQATLPKPIIGTAEPKPVGDSRNPKEQPAPVRAIHQQQSARLKMHRACRKGRVEGGNVLEYIVEDDDLKRLAGLEGLRKIALANRGTAPTSGLYDIAVWLQPKRGESSLTRGIKQEPRPTANIEQRAPRGRQTRQGVEQSSVVDAAHRLQPRLAQGLVKR